MLEFFRQHVGGGLLGVLLVGLLAAAFAFSFGAQSKGWGEGQSEQIAAVAAGYDISESTLDYAYNLLGGRGLNPGDSNAAALKVAAMEGLIERGLLLAAAEKIGITASSDEAVDRIVESDVYLTRPLNSIFDRMTAYPFFDAKDATEILVSAGHRIPQSFSNDEGEFNVDFYKNFIRNHLRQTEDSFIEQQRLELIAERMRQLMVSGIRISEDEVRNEYERESDTATIRYIRIIPAYFSDKLKPTAEELDEWAKAHADEVKKYYEDNQFRYTDLEEQVRARHILIKADKDADQSKKDAAKAKIEDILKRVRDGEDFAALAKEFSEDPGSGMKGGDLGYNPRGRMVPEFDKVMFALKLGDISDVVETQYGYHIIKVEGTRKGNVSLEEATPEIADKLYREDKGKTEAETTAKAFIERIKAGEKMDDVIPKDADNTGPLSMKVSTSRKFASTATSIPGIGQAEEMVKAAFDDKEGAEMFAVGGDYYIMETAERSKPSDEEFAKKKDSLESELLAKKQANWLVNEMNEMRKSAEAEGKIKVIYQPAAAQNVETPAPTPAKADKKAPKKSAAKDAKKPVKKKAAPAGNDNEDEEEADGE